jgi:DNA-binding NtrC family response regulator
MRIHVLTMTTHEVASDILHILVSQSGVQVHCCSDVVEFQRCIANEKYDLIFVDEFAEAVSDPEFLRSINSRQPSAATIVVKAPGVISVRQPFLGQERCIFWDYPLAPIHILTELETVRASQRLWDKKKAGRLPRKTQLHFLIGMHPLIVGLRKKIKKLASKSDPILITGEPGTGKELVANAIHYYSPRRQSAFQRVLCEALSEAILERQLFGYTLRTSIGKVLSYHKGKLELAQGGTIFFDRIDHMPVRCQEKLVKLIGGHSSRKRNQQKGMLDDIRIIASTDKCLEEEVTANRFSKDLYYHLKTTVVDVPPIRKIKDDIPLLVRHFIRKYSALSNRSEVTPSVALLNLLKEHRWQGNVRELGQVIEHAFIRCTGNTMEVSDLPRRFLEQMERRPPVKPEIQTYPSTYKVAKKQFEKEYLEWALASQCVNISHTAEAIGITRRNLQLKIQQLGIKVNRLKKQASSDRKR